MSVGAHWHASKEVSATEETHLETTNDEVSGLEAVKFGVLKEEKIDWVLVGDNAVFQTLRYNIVS